jgi:hypothetical protein
VTPSPEEIKAGKDASRRIGTYEARKHRLRRSLIRVGILGLGFLFCVHALGGGWMGLLAGALLWVTPVIFIRFLLRWERHIDLKTMQSLHEKYGSAIDSQLGPESSPPQ